MNHVSSHAIEAAQDAQSLHRSEGIHPTSSPFFNNHYLLSFLLQYEPFIAYSLEEGTRERDIFRGPAFAVGWRRIKPCSDATVKEVF